MCLHSFSPGVAGTRKVTYDGYRRFLAAESRARQKSFRFRGVTYQFKYGHNCVCYLLHVNYLYMLFDRDVCAREDPRYRDTALARSALMVARRRRLEQFLGHKYVPLVANWPGFDFTRYNVPELMHGMFLTVFRIP